MRIGIIGGGNISNTRHIPALRKIKNVNIVGVIGISQERVSRTCKENNIKNGLVVNDPKNDIEKVKKCDWFKTVDAVVIGTPPSQHHPLAKMCLLLKKDVLVEKPMTMNVKEAKELIDLAKKNKCIFNVVHNFNFTSGMNKINKIIETKKYGEVESITEVQLTNRDRRLPTWYNDLPLGLFYDEAAHFIYLLIRHGGEFDIKDVNSLYSKNNKENTPDIISANLMAGEVPVHMYLDFSSPVCEWYYVVKFKKRIIYYDLFKDIVIDLPSDGEHLAKEVLSNDLSRKHQYWVGFIKNGFKRVFGNLLYGHDEVLKKFINAVQTRKSDEYMTGEMGLKTVDYMNRIVEMGQK